MRMDKNEIQGYEPLPEPEEIAKRLRIFEE